MSDPDPHRAVIKELTGRGNAPSLCGSPVGESQTDEADLGPTTVWGASRLYVGGDGE